jgi:hypothetical protein
MTELPVQAEIISKLGNANQGVRVAALEAITAVAPYCESYISSPLPIDTTFRQLGFAMESLHLRYYVRWFQW